MQASRPSVCPCRAKQNEGFWDSGDGTLGTRLTIRLRQRPRRMRAWGCFNGQGFLDNWLASRKGKASGLAEDHHPVRVGPLGVVVHSPAVGCFGELVVVDQHQDRRQPGLDPAGENRFLQLDLSAAYFTDLEGHMPARAEQAEHFLEYGGHHVLPLLELLRDRQSDGGRVDADEPAAQPVVSCVIDNIQERRRGHHQRDTAGRNFRRG